MFDFHMHSRVSFDGHDTGLELAQAAKAAGLKEICFTDHMDYVPEGWGEQLTYDLDAYRREYDDLSLDGLTIRRGVEFGLFPDSRETMARDLSLYPYDFVLGCTGAAAGAIFRLIGLM